MGNDPKQLEYEILVNLSDMERSIPKLAEILGVDEQTIESVVTTMWERGWIDFLRGKTPPEYVLRPEGEQAIEAMKQHHPDLYSRPQ